MGKTNYGNFTRDIYYTPTRHGAGSNVGFHMPPLKFVSKRKDKNKFKKPWTKTKIVVEESQKRRAAGGSAAAGYHSGRMKARTSVKKYKRSKKGRLMMDCVKHTLKAGGVVTRVMPSVAVGHATMAANTFTFNMWCAVLKALFHRCGFDFRTPTDEVPQIGDTSLDVTIHLGYKTYDQGAVNDDPFVVVIGSSLNDIALYYNNALRAWNNTSRQGEVTFSYIYLATSSHNPVLSESRLDLTQAKIKYMMTSELKVQNRTITAEEMIMLKMLIMYR